MIFHFLIPPLTTVHETNIFFRIKTSGSTDPIANRAIDFNNYCELDINLMASSLSTTNLEFSFGLGSLQGMRSHTVNLL